MLLSRRFPTFVSLYKILFGSTDVTTFLVFDQNYTKVKKMVSFGGKHQKKTPPKLLFLVSIVLRGTTNWQV